MRTRGRPELLPLPERRVYTAAEAAAVLAIDRHTLYRRLKSAEWRMQYGAFRDDFGDWKFSKARLHAKIDGLELSYESPVSYDSRPMRLVK